MLTYPTWREYRTVRPDHCGYIDTNRHKTKEEFERQGFILENSELWRISDLNKRYEICEIYPKKLLVPASVSLNLPCWPGCEK